MRALWSGSPPRMRGKVAGGVIIGVLLGITPAYAGKRVRDSFCKDIRWDHPRVCGEKPRRGSGLNLILGSPPRMRGKEAAGLVQILGCRITPAYAGKRWTRLPSRAAMRDHPRVCGEKTAEQFKAEYPQGSPPRMRGKAQSYGSGSCPHRITPAYAGKSEVPGWAAETA